MDPKVKQILSMGRKLQALAKAEENDVIANAMANLASAFESFGASFGPKNMNDVIKRTGLSKDIIQMLIKRAQGTQLPAEAMSEMAVKIQEGLGDMAHVAERDHEVQMARAELYKIAKYAIKLHEMLKNVSEAEGLEGWQQAKITKAGDYIDSVYHSLEYDMKVMTPESKTFKSSMTESEIVEYKAMLEKAKSKAQQKFMGMVYAAKKGEEPASKEVAKVAKGMSKKAAKDYAKTKHKGKPEHVKKK